MRKATQPSRRDSAFVDWLNSLVEGERRGELAGLRRGLMYESDQLFLLLGHIPEQFLRQLSTRQEELDYLLVAALFASSQLSYTEEQLEKERRNIGDSLRELAESDRIEGEGDGDGRLPEPLKRRLEAMLASPREELPEHLRQTVSLLKSRGIPVDWAQLLCDLRAWNWARNPVQWDWSRAFYVGRSLNENTGGDE